MRMRALLLTAIACLLASCGPDAADSPSVLNRGTGEEPESLDVHRANSTEAGHVLRDLGEGLVGYSPGGELVAAAAVSWSNAANPAEYVFELRPGARWSNGEPVTANDFVYSYRRLVDPDTAAVYVDSIRDVAGASAIIAGEQAPDTLGVVALSEYQLRITLEQPVPYFLGLLTHPSMFPLHQASVEAHGERHARPGNLVTNGAYALKDWAVGSYIELEKNPHYWNSRATSIDIVRHHVTPEPTAELNRYLAGELHTTRTVPTQSFAALQASHPGQVRVSEALGVYFYGFNMTDPRFRDNPQLREALSMAIDRDVIVAIVGRGEKPAYSLVPPGTANYTPSRYSWADMDKAERERRAAQLMQVAGFGPDETLQVELRYNTHATHEEIALAIASMWETVLGVQTTLINEEFQVLLGQHHGQDRHRSVSRQLERRLQRCPHISQHTAKR